MLMSETGSNKTTRKTRLREINAYYLYSTNMDNGGSWLNKILGSRMTDLTRKQHEGSESPISQTHRSLDAHVARSKEILSLASLPYELSNREVFAGAGSEQTIPATGNKRVYYCATSGMIAVADKLIGVMRVACSLQGMRAY